MHLFSTLDVWWLEFKMSILALLNPRVPLLCKIPECLCSAQPRVSVVPNLRMSLQRPVPTPKCPCSAQPRVPVQCLTPCANPSTDTPIRWRTSAYWGTGLPAYQNTGIAYWRASAPVYTGVPLYRRTPYRGAGVLAHRHTNVPTYVVSVYTLVLGTQEKTWGWAFPGTL